jgi:hypothetical protein
MSDRGALIPGVGFLGGVLVGLAAIAVWAFGVWGVEAYKFKRAFGPLAGDYEVRRKQSSALEPYKVALTVSRNVLGVRYVGWPDGSCEGEIVMSRVRRGAGHYSSLKGGDELWGFWDVQMAGDGTVLVHETYAKEETKTQVVSGYRWTPLEG